MFLGNDGGSGVMDFSGIAASTASSRMLVSMITVALISGTFENRKRRVDWEMVSDVSAALLLQPVSINYKSKITSRKLKKGGSDSE